MIIIKGQRRRKVVIIVVVYKYMRFAVRNKKYEQTGRYSNEKILQTTSSSS